MNSRKYYWTVDEEKRLRELWDNGITDFEALAKEVGRKPGAIEKKLERMGVVVVKKPQKTQTTTSVPLSKDLPTHEETLKVLAGAMQMLKQPGLDKIELQRLRILVDACETYDSTLEKFEKWIDIEQRLVEVEKWIDEERKKAKAKTMVS